MSDTFWWMQRVQNMRDGLALVSIQRKVQGEEMLASMEASKVLENDWRTPVCAGCGALSTPSGRSGREYWKTKI